MTQRLCLFPKTVEAEMSRMVGSVSCLIEAVRKGDSAAQFKIWDRYHGQLRGVAKTLLSQSSQTVADDDDVVTEAFCSVLRRLASGQYQQLATRQELWKLLATATSHKAISQMRFYGRKRRAASSLQHSPAPLFAETHVTVLEFADLVKHLLEKLLDDDARRICVLRLDGCSIQEIATQISKSVPTVERRLRLIREIWNKVIIDE